MSVGEVLAILGGAAATLSAGASIVSARAAALGNRPWVRGEVTGEAPYNLTVTLSNDGPGLAVDVRSCIVSLYDMWSNSLGSLLSGACRDEDVPKPANFVKRPFHLLFVETEFSDLGGGRWRLTNEGSAREWDYRLQRLRASRLD